MNNGIDDEKFNLAFNKNWGVKLSNALAQKNTQGEESIFEGLTKSEFVEKLGLEESDEYYEALTLFELMDTNGDGKLNSDELSSSEDGKIDSISELYTKTQEYMVKLQDANQSMENITGANIIYLDKEGAYDVLKGYVDNTDDYTYNEEGGYFYKNDNSEFYKFMVKNGNILVAKTSKSENSQTREVFSANNDIPISKFLYAKDGNNQNKLLYQELYNDNTLMHSYIYSEETGRLVSRQNYETIINTSGQEARVVTSVTLYDSEGSEIETTSVFDNPNAYMAMQATNEVEKYMSNQYVADFVIDGSYQGETGDCWLLNGLQALSRTQWGQKAILNSISQLEDGSYQVILKGNTYKVTQQEINNVLNPKATVFTLQEGEELYVDGTLKDLSQKDTTTVRVDNNLVHEGVTIVDKNGNETVYTPDDLTAMRYEEGYSINSDSYYKFSSGDLDTLIFELAFEKYRNGSIHGGKAREVILALANCTEETTELLDGLLRIERNPGEYANEVMIHTGNYDSKTGTDWHSVSIVSFTKDENGNIDTITYSNPWHSNELTTESYKTFKGKVVGSQISLFRDISYNPDFKIDSNLNIEEYQACEKRDLSETAKIIKQYIARNGGTLENTVTQNEYGSFEINFPYKEEPVIVYPFEIEIAKQSKNYDTGDDDLTILEVAIEKALNNINPSSDEVLALFDTVKDVNTFAQEMSKSKNISIDIDSKSNSFGATEKIDIKMINLQSFVNNSNYFVVGYSDMNGKYFYLKGIETAPNGSKVFVLSYEDNPDLEIAFTDDEFMQMNNIDNLWRYNTK